FPYNQEELVDTYHDVAETPQGNHKAILEEEEEEKLIQEQEIPVSQAMIGIPKEAAKIDQPSILDKMTAYFRQSFYSQPNPKPIGGSRAMDEEVASAPAIGLPEEVQARLEEYYQRSFSHVNPWFESTQATLPIEKAQFHLLALQQNQSSENSQEEDEEA